MRKHAASLGKNAAILGFAGIVVKILGAVYRIPITAMILSEGIGYYQTAYPVYEIMLMISTAGLPVAVATMVSRRIAEEKLYEAERTFRVALSFMGALGIVLAAGLYVFARPIVAYCQNPGAYYALIALVPSMLFSPLLAAMRGYYQGLQMMTPTAVSQIIVQIVRVGAGLYLTHMLVSKSLMAGAGGASLGASIGAAMGFLYMLLIHFRTHKHLPTYGATVGHASSAGSLFSEMVRIAVPITLGATIVPIMDFIDVRMVLEGLLTAGFGVAEANMRFGWLKGMATTLINLPQVFAVAIAVSIIPLFTQLRTVGRMDALRERLSIVYKMTFLLALPSCIGLFVLSRPIVELLYPTTGETAISGTAMILRLLSFSLPALMLISIQTATLQAMGRERVPVYLLLVGAAVKIALTFFLTRNPKINVFGAAVGSVVGYWLTAMLDGLACYRILGVRMFNLQAGVILLTSVLMGVMVHFTFPVFSGWMPVKLATLVTVTLAGLLYTAAVWGGKLVRKEEISLLRRVL